MEARLIRLESLAAKTCLVESSCFQKSKFFLSSFSFLGFRFYFSITVVSRISLWTRSCWFRSSLHTLPAKIKGVYDHLLVSREDQARYPARGKGKHEAIPSDILGTMDGEPSYDFLRTVRLIPFFSFLFLFFCFNRIFQGKDWTLEEEEGS